MANANIFGMVGQGVRSPLDYAGDYQRIEAGRAAVEANKLATMLGQQKADEYSRGVAEQNRLRDLSRTWSAETTDDQRIGSLKNSGFFQQADALEKSLLERQKTGAEVGAKQADTKAKEYDTQRKKFEHRIQGLSQFQDAQGAKQWLADSVLSGALSMEEAQQMVAKVPTDPAAFGQWRDSAVMSLMDAGKQAGFIKPDANAQLSAQTSAANNAANNARMAQEGAANRAVSMRGQNMTDARARDLNTITKADKEAARKEAAVEKEVTKFSTTLQKEGIPEIETALQGAEAIFSKYTDPKTGKAKDIPGIGPIKNALPDWAVSSEGKDARESLAAVANIVLAARSGAAVTDQELRRLARELSNSVGAGPDDMQRAYGKFRTRFEAVKANLAAGASDEVKRTYEDRGGVKITRGGAKPAATNIDSLLDKYK